MQSFSLLAAGLYLAVLGAAQDTSIYVTINTGGVTSTAGPLPPWPTVSGEAYPSGSVSPVTTLSVPITYTTAVTTILSGTKTVTVVVPPPSGNLSSVAPTFAVSTSSKPAVVAPNATTSGPATVPTAAADRTGFEGSMMGLVMFFVLSLLIL